MPRLYLVRHAKPAAGWGQETDPGLDTAGIAQAETVASKLASVLHRLRILSSPLRRCRETAQPLERSWQQTAAIFPAVAELPTPPLNLVARHEWLAAAMLGTWTELQESAPTGSIDYLAWRQTLLGSLTSLQHDSVIFTHFIAINVMVGAARGVDNVVCFRPNHASVTIVETSEDGLRIARLGREAITTVMANSDARLRVN